MPKEVTYKKVATIYSRNGKKVKMNSVSGNSSIYNTLDKLETGLRLISDINKIIRGTDGKKAKKSSKKKKPAAPEKLMMLKSAKYLKSAKVAPRIKK